MKVKDSNDNSESSQIALKIEHILKNVEDLNIDEQISAFNESLNYLNKELEND